MVGTGREGTGATVHRLTDKRAKADKKSTVKRRGRHGFGDVFKTSTSLVTEINSVKPAPPLTMCDFPTPVTELSCPPRNPSDAGVYLFLFVGVHLDAHHLSDHEHPIGRLPGSSLRRRAISVRVTLRLARVIRPAGGGGGVSGVIRPAGRGGGVSGDSAGGGESVGDSAGIVLD